MGGHEKRGSSKEEADRHRQLPRDAGHCRDTDSKRKSSRDSKEPAKNSEMPLVERNMNANALGNDRCNDQNKTQEATATGSTRSAPADNERTVTAGSSASSSHDDRFDELYNIMGTIISKINSMDSNGPSQSHTISDSDHDDDDDDDDHDTDGNNPNDPMDHLSVIFGQNDESSVDSDQVDFTKALAEFAGGFASKEEKGDAIHEAYAAVLNDSLRNKPNDATVKQLVQ